MQTHVVKNVRLIVCAASVSPASESSKYLERSLELHAKGRERAREARALPLIRAFSPAFIAIRNGELGVTNLFYSLIIFKGSAFRTLIKFAINAICFYLLLLYHSSHFVYYFPRVTKAPCFREECYLEYEMTRFGLKLLKRAKRLGEKNDLLVPP